MDTVLESLLVRAMLLSNTGASPAQAAGGLPRTPAEMDGSSFAGAGVSFRSTLFLFYFFE